MDDDCETDTEIHKRATLHCREELIDEITKHSLVELSCSETETPSFSEYYDEMQSFRTYDYSETVYPTQQSDGIKNVDDYDKEEQYFYEKQE